MFVGSPVLLSKSSFPSVITLDPIKNKLLGINFESNLNFSYFGSLAIQTPNFHIQAMKQVREVLFLPTAVTFTVSFVISKWNYCDSLLCGLPGYVFTKLQSLQNYAAKIVL